MKKVKKEFLKLDKEVISSLNVADQLQVKGGTAVTENENTCKCYPIFSVDFECVNKTDRCLPVVPSKDILACTANTMQCSGWCLYTEDRVCYQESRNRTCHCI